MSYFSYFNLKDLHDQMPFLFCTFEHGADKHVFTFLFSKWLDINKADGKGTEILLVLNETIPSFLALKRTP